MNPHSTAMSVLALLLTIVTVSDTTPQVRLYAGTALAVLAVGYVLACRLFPFRACRACGGRGRDLSRGVFGGIRLCHRCNATGLRLRAGVKAWNYLRRPRRPR